MLVLLLAILGGALIGLFPYFILSWMGRSDLAKKAFLCTMVSGVCGLSLFVAVGFVIYAILKRNEGGKAAVHWEDQSLLRGRQAGSLKVTCISGQLRGQTYQINANGIIIGRDYDCAIRLSADTAGISRHHCSLRWNNGILYLTDLGSGSGTFLSNGTRVFPQQPQPLYAGSMFYLASPINQFQIIQ